LRSSQICEVRNEPIRDDFLNKLWPEAILVDLRWPDGKCWALSVGPLLSRSFRLPTS